MYLIIQEEGSPKQVKAITPDIILGLEEGLISVYRYYHTHVGFEELIDSAFGDNSSWKPVIRDEDPMGGVRKC